jgi:hypothetical protein
MPSGSGKVERLVVGKWRVWTMETCYGEGGDREPRGEIGGAENSALDFGSIF